MPSRLSPIPSLPSTRKALTQSPSGVPVIASSLPLPSLAPGDILIKVSHVALNPCDYKMPTAFPTPGAIIGNDFVGSIVSLHPDTHTRLQIGDTVCGLVHGSNPGDPTNGAFATYIRAPAALVLKVPQGCKLEDAAALGSGLTTASVALWGGGLELPFHPDAPAKEKVDVLVYGGSTSTGTMAMQLLKLSGARVIATCSERNFGLVREYGADEVFDYKEPETVKKIKEVTGGELEYALDIIADRESVGCCQGSISRFGGSLTVLELWKGEGRKTVDVRFPLALEVFGKELELGKGYERPASRERRKQAEGWFSMFQRLLDEGKLKAHPVRMLDKGFESVVEGLKVLKSGGVSGYKLVVPLE